MENLSIVRDTHTMHEVHAHLTFSMARMEELLTSGMSKMTLTTESWLGQHQDRCSIS